MLAKELEPLEFGGVKTVENQLVKSMGVEGFRPSEKHRNFGAERSFVIKFR